MWQCKNCGQNNSDNSRYCGNCGCGKESNPQKDDHADKTTDIRFTRRMAIIMSCILLVAVVCVWIWQSAGKRPEATSNDDDPGIWVSIKDCSYYKGSLDTVYEYRYGEYGRSELYMVRYNSYDGTETHQRTVYEYDDNGANVKDVTYDDETGEIIEYTEYTYDRNGELTQSNTFSADGTLLRTEEYLSKEELHDVVVESYTYDNGEKKVSTSKEYDQNGNLVKSVNYDSNGDLLSVSEYTYDENGKRVTSSFSFYFLGKLQDIDDTSMEYDDEGMLVRELSVSRGTGDITISELTYDENGNEVLYVSTCNGEERLRVETEFGFYKNGIVYDENGNELNWGDSSCENTNNGNVREGQRIVVHRGWVLGVTDEGTVLAAGGDNLWGENMAVAWTDVVAIDAAVNGNFRTVLGLKKDGTVVAAGWDLSGECDVSDWTDIVQIEAIIGNSYGLKSDGTMVATGDNNYGECNVDNITNGKQMYMQEHSNNCILVLNKDGTVEATADHKRFADANFSPFKNISNLGLGWSELYGVTNEGRVVSNDLPSEISQWTDIQRVYVHEVHDDLVIGLHKDGTISAYAKYNDRNEDEVVRTVETWMDIKDIVILAEHGDSGYSIIGIKNNGTLVSVGSIDLTGFDNIRELYAYDDSYTSFAYLVGVRNDGTVVSNDPAVADAVAKWKLF